jgi:formylglycine-generating enzyme required for sulfatase activity
MAMRFTMVHYGLICICQVIALREAKVRFPQIVAAAWLALCAAVPAHADKRVALVIGNAAYRHADLLFNPVHDARGMRDALQKLGFDVIYGEDLDLKAMQQKIGQFAGHVDGADVAVVYFAGHGSTFDGTPYVVPVDAEFLSVTAAPYELVPVETLIGELRQAKAKGVRIAILDACRDNKAERELKRTRGEATRGLAPLKPPSGMIIAYATQRMSTAADDAAGAGSGGTSAHHSPFTAALLNNIATPGLDVTDMFRRVGREVEAATGGRQQPEISIVSMYEQYDLVPGAPKLSDAAQAWVAVQATTSMAALDDFLRHFGHVPIYGPLARTRRDELVKELAAAKELARGPVKPPEAPEALAKPAEGQQTAAVAPPVKPAAPAGEPCAAIVRVFFPSRCAAPLTVSQERALKPKDSFRECENCPEMVAVPAGSFTMGSPADEKDREPDEGPQQVVTIVKPFAVGRLPVTVDQFAVFVREAGYEASSKCNIPAGGNKWEEKGSWRDPGFVQEGSHPVVCVSWNDANAYADWLAKRTGKPYRLLTEAEWEYAARGRTSPGVYPRFWFGDDENDLCRHANGMDWAFGSRFGAPCNDGYARTSPAGHYGPNAFGLYDMAGNAGQWIADCYHNSYHGLPADGSAWPATACSGNDGRVVRGGAWDLPPRELRAARRDSEAVEHNSIGFRLARTLTR